MQPETLRGLSRLYASGGLEKEAYRSARRQLIAEVVSGQRPPGDFDNAAGNPHNVSVSAPLLDPLVTQSTRAESKSAAPTKLLTAFVLLALAGGLASTWHFLRPAAVPIQLPPSGEVQQLSGQTLLGSFLLENTWHQNALTAFVGAWRTLPAEEQTRLRNSTEAQRMRDAVNQQIRANKALSALGESADSDTMLSNLETLAAELSLTNAPWESNEPPVPGEEQGVEKITPRRPTASKVMDGISPALSHERTSGGTTAPRTREPGENRSSALAETTFPALETDSAASGEHLPQVQLSGSPEETGSPPIVPLSEKTAPVLRVESSLRTRPSTASRSGKPESGH